MFELQDRYNTAKIFTDNVEETAISQIIELCNQEFVKDSKIRIMPDCLTEDTEILTTNGFKLIKDLTLNDKIANYDNVDKKIFFDHPKNIIIRPVRDGETIYKYYNKQHNFHFLVSENHRMAIKDNMGQIAKNINQFKMSEMVFNAFGLKDNVNTSKYSDNEIKLICWIVGDGNIKITHNKNSDNYRIRFGLKKERKIERLLKLLNEERLNYNISRNDKQTTIIINTKDSQKYINIVGMKKSYPKDFIYLNKDQSEKFIDEIIYIDGDYESYTKKRGYRINSTLKENVDIISAIFAINYGYSKINFRQIKSSYGISNLYYINGICYDTLQYSRSGVHSRMIKREIEKYTGSLVCIECTTSYFIARQNGLTFITGNCHSGAGCTIGTTMTISDKVVPNLVGVDIGCGMYVVKLKDKDIDLKLLDRIINDYIPSGFNIRDKIHEYNKYVDYSNLRCKNNFDLQRAKLSIGTLGGGNHFIEVNKDKNNNLYLVVHSGSRYLGKQVAEYYQNKGYKKLNDNHDEIQSIINKMKSKGREKDIQSTIEKLKPKKFIKSLAWVEGNDLNDYLNDMQIVQTYASCNRTAIALEILEKMNIGFIDDFETVHNYIDIGNNMLRKGAVSAKKNEKLIIPINMRDGSLICVGKGNEDWNYSAPHGAGRLMSRSKAKERISLDDFKKSMDGIYSTSVNQSTLDESPMAYKPINEIIENIKDTVDVVDIIKPIYNFKSSN